MNLKRIRTFMLVVDHKNFSTVAELLDISQPAVSKQIKTLEEELGVLLLHRDAVEPTEAGRLVYKTGKKLLQAWDELAAECRAQQGEMSGLLRIGASTIPGSHLMPAILREFRDRYPRIEVKLSVHDSKEVQEQLRDGKLDIGVIGMHPKPDVTSHLLAKDRMVLVGPVDSEDVDGFGDVRGLPFIFREEGSGTWDAAKNGLHKWGGSVNDLKQVAVVDSTEAVISLVEAGLGYSILSDLAAQQATQHGRVKVLAELPEEREFYLIYPDAKRHLPALSALVNLAVNE